MTSKNGVNNYDEYIDIRIISNRKKFVIVNKIFNV